MGSYFAAPAIVALVLGPGAVLRAGEAPGASDPLASARRLGWQMATIVVERLEAGDQSGFPGIEAWVKDFERQTKGIGLEVAPEKWPSLDVDGLTVNNGHFWRAYYEIAPGDPGLALLHAGLLLASGEASRAVHVVEFYRLRPGVPGVVDDMFKRLAAASNAAGSRSNTAVQAGIKLYDRGDYEGALTKYREALDIWPQNGWAYYELGFTLRTQQLIAAGEKLMPMGAARTTTKVAFSPEVETAFAKSRHHTPFQYMAYQGHDQEVIQGFLALGKKVVPAMKTLRRDGNAAEKDRALEQLAEGCQEAGAHELALVARQILVARRGRYDPADHPFIANSLRKLASGAQTEAVLKRLAGGRIAFRQLVATEPESPDKRSD